MIKVSYPRTMSDTQWLTPDQQRAWRAYLEATTLLFDALDRQLQAEAGMPHGYYEILVRLSEAEDRAMRMSELAARTRSSRSRLSHAIARLEERGWVMRTDAPTDRRGQVAQLTAKGLGVLTAAAPGHVAAVRAAVIERLTPEQIAQLESIGTAIVEGLCPGGDGAIATS
jgi:DNA-binding MarR family transcriptional regulator